MATNKPSDGSSTRARIKRVAARLYVLRGHDGFSFGDIAEATGTTRANIHHHFGSKRLLMEELIADIAEDARLRIERCWTGPADGFGARLDTQLADLEFFYRRFNPGASDRNLWSPLSRLRHDLAVLGEPAGRALEAVNRTYQRVLTSAVREAIDRGEFRPQTPVDSLVCLVRVTVLACPPMTQDTGTFDEVTRVFAALKQTIGAAWAPARDGP